MEEFNNNFTHYNMYTVNVKYIVCISYFVLTMNFLFPVPLRSANEPPGGERHQQRLCAEAIRLQHCVRAHLLHKPP